MSPEFPGIPEFLLVNNRQHGCARSTEDSSARGIAESQIHRLVGLEQRVTRDRNFKGPAPYPGAKGESP